jgi:hypothetical protein
MKRSLKQPRWGDAQQTFIVGTIATAQYGEVTFHAMPTDPESAGRELYARCLAGEFGEIAPYQPNVMSFLMEREQRLRQAQAALAGLTEAFVAGLLNDEAAAHFKAWAAYQRDLMQLAPPPSFPAQIAWPTPPTA